MLLKKAQMMVALACCCCFSIDAVAQTNPSRVLLVCGIESEIPPLSHTEVRKLFLGLPIDKKGQRLKPLRNASDPLLTEVFLQKVIFMSKRKYEGQLVARVFRLGGVRPKVYKNLDELVDVLQQSPATVSYMWSDQLEQTTNLKSIGVLWEGSAQ